MRTPSCSVTSRTADVAGSLVVSTCNRVEVYAEVDSSMAGSRRSASCSPATPACAQRAHRTGYVHYEDRAVQHLLAVACGLESMVIGESQILGQVRQAVKLARQHGTLSRELSDLSRLALRAGRRAHAETGIDAAGQNLVTLGLAAAVGWPDRRGARPSRRWTGCTSGHRGRIDELARGHYGCAEGGGRSSSPTGRRARRSSSPPGPERARPALRAARRAGGRGSLIACTGAAGHVIGADAVTAALAARRRGSGRLRSCCSTWRCREISSRVGNCLAGCG